jgi:hypothetical protein
MTEPLRRHKLRALLILIKEKHPNYSAIDAFDWATKILDTLEAVEKETQP